uniref:Uncharacterized protein n=1 Tax=Oryctolagus cuniculus TaxID=9986 RepID=A0A5F9DT96_RABIT
WLKSSCSRSPSTRLGHQRSVAALGAQLAQTLGRLGHVVAPCRLTQLQLLLGVGEKREVGERLLLAQVGGRGPRGHGCPTLQRQQGSPAAPWKPGGAGRPDPGPRPARRSAGSALAACSGGGCGLQLGAAAGGEGRRERTGGGEECVRGAEVGERAVSISGSRGEVSASPASVAGGGGRRRERVPPVFFVFFFFFSPSCPADGASSQRTRAAPCRVQEKGSAEQTWGAGKRPERARFQHPLQPGRQIGKWAGKGYPGC